jgi:GxxExxY protein
MENAPLGLKHSGLTETIIGAFYDVYHELGQGFLESAYAEAMAVALEEAELQLAREFSVPVWFRGRKLGQYFADMIIADKILLALKAARNLESAHEGQLLHYLKASEIDVGRLLNFGMRPQFRRLLFHNERKKIRAHRCASVAKVSA